MDSKISVVINTLNDEAEISRAIESVKWADEIIVCDMESEDKTVTIAKKLGAKVFEIKRMEFVEPARNLAISRATNEWILILDPDEEIPTSLKERLLEIAQSFKQINYVRIPRKNIIFNHWVKGAMWWPDYNIRFFRKGKVKWNNKIHRPPEVVGVGLDLDAKEEWSILHHHYNSISEYLERLQRYTKIQSEELIQDGYKFYWPDLIRKPLSEFLSRYFASKGFEDGLHGLVLSILQAFSFFIVYLKVWENDKFTEKQIKMDELKVELKNSSEQLNYWVKYNSLSSNPFKRFIQKAAKKL